MVKREQIQSERRSSTGASLQPIALPLRNFSVSLSLALFFKPRESCPLYLSSSLWSFLGITAAPKRESSIPSGHGMKSLFCYYEHWKSYTKGWVERALGRDKRLFQIKRLFLDKDQIKNFLELWAEEMYSTRHLNDKIFVISNSFQIGRT